MTAALARIARRFTRAAIQKCSSQHRCGDRKSGFRLHRNETRFTFGNTRFQVSSYFGSGFSAFDRRIPAESMGDVLFLSEANEGDLVVASANTDHLWSLPLLEKCALSGWKCVCFSGGSVALWIAGRSLRYDVHLPFIDLFVRREERQLERDFGEQWLQYRKRVRRWL
jgi:hypothetical protein